MGTAPEKPYLTAVPPSAAVEWVRGTFEPGSTVTEIRRLTGGVSSAIHAIVLKDPRGEFHTVVLRRWARPDWQVTDPDFTVAREALALRTVAATSFATPRPLAADERGRHCDVPALLMSFLPGSAPDPGPADLGSFLEQLALAAVETHQLRVKQELPPYRPYNSLEDPRVPAPCRHPDLWLRAFEIVAAGPPPEESCLIHRDYHFGNTLWTEGRLTGIVDWGYASQGPASIDIAHMRWNLVVGYGKEAADEFLAAYTKNAPGRFSHHPYWDLRTLVDLTPEPIESSFGATDIARLENYLQALLNNF
ncbi:phosphotransferase family protein [Streptomyces sp. NPDC088400]|uniref:phosphotransferase family protein n=1 Tax=Streptomyces sp. NPDC088400 TaxID=3365861 RepID=UPI00381A6FBF